MNEVGFLSKKQVAAGARRVVGKTEYEYIPFNPFKKFVGYQNLIPPDSVTTDDLKIYPNSVNTAPSIECC